MKLDRGTCPVCTANVALRKDNIVREHFDHREALFGAGPIPAELVKCKGAGMKVEQRSPAPQFVRFTTKRVHQIAEWDQRVTECGRFLTGADAVRGIVLPDVICDRCVKAKLARDRATAGHAPRSEATP